MTSKSGRGLYRRYVARCRRWSSGEARAVLFSGLVTTAMGLGLASTPYMPWWGAPAGTGVSVVGLAGVLSAWHWASRPCPVKRPTKGDDEGNP